MTLTQKLQVAVVLTCIVAVWGYVGLQTAKLIAKVHEKCAIHDLTR